LTEINKYFFDYFVEISAKLSVYSRVVVHQIFHTKTCNRHEEEDWLQEINFLKTFAHYTVPKTMKAKILQMKKKLMERYDNCTQLHFYKSCITLNDFLKTELNNLRGINNTNKIVIIANRLRNKIDKNDQFSSLEKKSDEIQDL